MTGEQMKGGFEGQIQMAEDFDEEDAELVAAIERSTIFPGQGLSGGNM